MLVSRNDPPGDYCGDGECLSGLSRRSPALPCLSGSLRRPHSDGMHYGWAVGQVLCAVTGTGILSRLCGCAPRGSQIKTLSWDLYH